jgi:class 3 adenylate cyclase
LIGIDEEGTLAQLKALRKTLFDPKIAEHHGRIVKNTGDGALVEFGRLLRRLGGCLPPLSGISRDPANRP